MAIYNIQWKASAKRELKKSRPALRSFMRSRAGRD
jgi:hypothetical protein